MNAREGYHHGDLKRGLVEAAVEILDDEGVSGLTLRAVARRAGVSRQAPYNHFRDVDHLVAAVAVEAFSALEASLRGEWAEGAPQDPSHLQDVGVRYVRFAVENPGRFRTMFGPHLRRRAEFPDLAAAADRVFALLSAPPGALFPQDVKRPAETGSGPSEGSAGGVPPDDVRVALWSMVHGLAHLLVDRQLTGAPPDGEAAERYARAATEALWFGLVNEQIIDEPRNPGPIPE